MLRALEQAKTKASVEYSTANTLTVSSITAYLLKPLPTTYSRFTQLRFKNCLQALTKRFRMISRVYSVNRLFQIKTVNTKETVKRSATLSIEQTSIKRYYALLYTMTYLYLLLNGLSYTPSSSQSTTWQQAVSGQLIKRQRNHITTTYFKRQQQVIQLLRQSQSLIHLTTDTWHSPNFKELQAITAHFVDTSNTRQKALLSLPELCNGYAGTKVATQIIATLEAYGITDRLGYITADNHSANDTMCEELLKRLFDTRWQPVQRRLRCIGHMINIAIQSFFFAKNGEAVDYAIQESHHSGASIDDELSQLSEKSDDTAGFIKVTPLQKILSLCTALWRSDK